MTGSKLDGRKNFRPIDNWGGNTYYLWIVEKAAMKQQVVADAKFMAEGINSTGHVAVYGIYFDFNKSDVI